uniref:Uncharacterized protein n=1 Tax=viral metagenome TaxID=1070528 RepID=A0A6M3JAI7_9ZZZZ
MLELVGVAKNGRLIFQPNSEQLYTRWLSDSENSFIKARFYRLGKNKTHKQCKTHFGLAIAIIREAMIDKGWAICGVAPNKEMIHEILLKTCGGVGALGAMKGLSEMTTIEASQFFENIRDWAENELRIVIPDPDPNWKDKDNDKNTVDSTNT